MLGNGFCCSSFFLGLVLLFLLLGSEAHTSKKELTCQKDNRTNPRVGVIFDSGSQIGKQQMVAMKMGLRDFHLASSCVKYKLELLLHDYSHPNFTSPPSSALDLITKGGVKAVIIGLSRKQDSIVIFDHKILVGIPILSISTTQLLHPLKIPSLIQMANNNITHHIIASILTHFQLSPKVTIFCEITNIHHPSNISVHRHFDSFRPVNIEINRLVALSSSSNIIQAEILIENELKKLMNNQRNGVFIVTQLSLELVDLLFTKAKKMNMIGNGYTWIVSHEVFDLISSLDSSSSLLNKMEGVIGFQTYFNDTKMSLKSFETKFKKIYKLEYPQEEEPTKASIFAIQAYDAAHAITSAMENMGVENLSSSSEELKEKILESNFEGVSGMVRFSKNNNGMLIYESPNFKIIKVVDHAYKEVAFWTGKFGFVEKSVEINKKEALRSNKMGKMGVRELSEMRVSKANSNNGERKLRFAVPGQGACQEFVNVSYYSNGTAKNFSGFSIDVSRAVMNNIKNISAYDLFPFNHSYDDMIKAVYHKEYDGAVGDITILAKRFEHVDFTVAYLNTDIVMVVTEKQEKWKRRWAFMEAFELPVWLLIPTMHIFVSFVIWLIEHQNNDELKGFGNMVWFSVSFIFYMHREPVKNGLARLVMGPWLFAILVVTTSFSASLTSLMTNSWSQPSVLDVETLKQMPDATVGCNSESFIYNYLNSTLEFEPSKIKKMNSIDDYPKALKNGSIKAAFFISPHADIFLAKNCKGYTKAVSSFKLGGIGFAFRKGSELGAEVSRSIAELTLANNISTMEHKLLESFKCSSSDKENGLGLGPEPFLNLFIICGSIALLVLMYIMGLQFMVSWKS
ncbi:glutamate receptor 2.5-like [Benincasa hispida]|uniref:glutamate receptor 2.5-like n=1 Tax=Benincasa hispida TaxID=102211 RepID=UPI0018FF777C|nr:glutamate receptor 2.5-like [Benincasa hispida]